jgi:hypothetical protein
MRKTILAAAFALCFASAAHAGEYALQVQGFFTHLFIPGHDWQSLYFDAPANGGGATVDTELFQGLGPYLTVEGVGVRRFIDGGIRVGLGLTEGALGASYRIFPAPWFGPSAHVGALYFRAAETIADNVFTYKLGHGGFGFDAGVDLNFYPWARIKNGARGIAFRVGAGYQLRPLAGFGDLKSVSGWNVAAGLAYRFDWGRREPAPPAPVPPSGP